LYAFMHLQNLDIKNNNVMWHCILSQLKTASYMFARMKPLKPDYKRGLGGCYPMA
jgi:hypothetical protein